MLLTIVDIETDHLSYFFEEADRVLDDVNLHVAQGSIYGFLGPNRAGKTTALRLLLSLLRSENSAVGLFRHPLKTSCIEIMARIG